ncbi:hypothetical protein BGZ81_005552 [Podila clonocystis]|nr:hypothetical protein BGZ81_005552 [Podila clonocystis]
MCEHSSGVRFEHKLYEKSPVLIPIEISRASNGENTDVFIAGVQDLAKRFTDTTEPVTREAVFQYLRAHIHGTPRQDTDSQSMPSMSVSENYNNINDELENVKNFDLENVKDFDLVKDLVLCQFRDDGGWIPHETQDYDSKFAEKMIRWYSNKLKEGKRNYFYLLLELLPRVVEKSDNQLELESTLLEIIDWCFIQAKDKGRPEELRHLIISIPELLTMRPRLASKITRLFAFFLAHDRQAIIDNLVISNPPVLQQVFETGPIRLEECSSSILRFRYDPNEPVKDREYFTESVFVAPFSLLWSVEMPKSKLTGDFEDPTPKAISGTSKSRERRPMNPDCDYMMFVPELHVYVRPRHYHLSLLDNPAIEALVEYKWNAFGYLLYYVRFFTQCGYYSLIVFAAFMQVYAENPTFLSSTFVAIIAMASWFLWHEFWQFVSSVLELVEIRKSAMFRRSKWYKRQIVPRYLKSQYNWLDLLAFIFPLVASVIQLVNIKQGNPDRAVCLLSFSLIIVFMHMVAELRVYRLVCKYVTIILRIFSEIKIFFGVFALGILCFSLAIEHVLRGRASGDYRLQVLPNGTGISDSTNQDGIDFPHHFFGAITSTYFIMGGRYDPVNNELKSGDNWALHIMIAIYFFFTVILMLNVLIALINGGFNKADMDWHLVWIENRLRYVESAENMSYQIPGFRQTHDWFPREIYYTATKEQVDEYNDRMTNKDGDSEQLHMKKLKELKKRFEDLLEEVHGEKTSAQVIDEESSRHSSINQGGGEQRQQAVLDSDVQTLQDQMKTIRDQQDKILEQLTRMAATRRDPSGSA